MDKLVPVLQRAGRFRTDYEGQTLRDHLGLPQFVDPRDQDQLRTGTEA
ncbi:hypothetical protein [Paracoccus benzoatiresistens]|uniref:Uncharacterized protein n=1 Tax=Paracoccus benzoatiresistens TaxID=2997341 RepID=A0ABT4J8E1_9RHOB|nr:hypothetical protein [Paracoccus sp. EF6]MCZ0963393.1 hypothetical protein [Paracoccus sp. EF6]